MATINKGALASIDLVGVDVSSRLQEAIDNWRPDRPRRWLHAYGRWFVDGGGDAGELVQQYRALRREAEKMLVRPRVESASGVPSHLLHLD